MSRCSRATRAVVISAALTASVLALPTAGAAKSDPSRACRHAAGNKSEIIRRGPTAVVFTKGDLGRHDFFVYACSFSKGKLMRLPGQDGGRTKRLYFFVLGKRYLGYAVQQLQAGVFDAFVDVVDVKRGRRIARSSAFPGGGKGSVAVESLLVKRDGTAAWIAAMDSANFGVHLLAKGAISATAVASGTDIDGSSLKSSSDESQISWLQGGQLMTAPFGASAGPGT